MTLVEPGLVAEIAVGTAQERGVWRHPVRYARLRLDVTAKDVPAFGEGALPTAVISQAARLRPAQRRGRQGR